MSTLFPGAIQTFPTMTDITATDAPYVKSYQEAMEQGNVALASQYLQQISNYSSKIINANLLNNIIDTTVAVQEFYEQRYSPAYVVSSSQPASQQVGDFWFKVI